MYSKSFFLRVIEELASPISSLLMTVGDSFEAHFVVSLGFLSLPVCDKPYNDTDVIIR
jgi:hypothetical protein